MTVERATGTCLGYHLLNHIHASQRVLLKIGLERRGERAFPHPDYAAEGAMARFERDAADWQAERGGCGQSVKS